MSEKMTRTMALKVFFSGETEPVSPFFPVRAVTNHELFELRKADPKLYDQLGEQAVVALGATLEAEVTSTAAA